MYMYVYGKYVLLMTSKILSCVVESEIFICFSNGYL